MQVKKSKLSVYLDTLLKDQSKKEKANDIIDKYIDALRNGYNYSYLKQVEKVQSYVFDLLFEIATARIAISKKFRNWNRLWVDKYLASYSTPESIAEYRTKRLDGFEVLDLGSGSGIQDLIFSEHTIKTIGVEKDPVRYRFCQLNAQEFEGNETKFIQGDALELNPEKIVNERTVIFSDPARPVSEMERSLQTLIPSPIAVYKIFRDYSLNFAFDLPPQIHKERITIDGETEYISIDGNLNRLTLYTGKISNGKSSAVMLPSGRSIRGEPMNFQGIEGELQEYVLLPDISASYAGLMHKIEELYPVTFLASDKRRVLFTSNERIPEFFGEQYLVLGTTNDLFDLKIYRENDVGKVFPRFELDDKEYYEIKNKIEGGLKGTNNLYIFKQKNQYILCLKV
ncbi:MAG: class I SAM-dependent methyltransferase [Thermoplasmatales archaeon]|nr:class I SAM-dependent methyltransferase [Thermoplasmatales archaeon]MCW6171098.1 class I SAM-dependent methyltransferase [Thermoplasmatales archaeon]